MPDVNYIITIKGDASANSISTNGVAPSMNMNGTSGNNDVKVPAAFKKIAPAAIALQFAKVAINSELNRVELRTGASTFQQRLDFAVQKGTQILGPIISGALTAGPYGAVVGAAVSAASIVNDAFQYAQKQSDINLNRSIENIGIGMANVRAGAGGDRTGQK